MGRGRGKKAKLYNIKILFLTATWINKWYNPKHNESDTKVMPSFNKTTDNNYWLQWFLVVNSIKFHLERFSNDW